LARGDADGNSDVDLCVLVSDGQLDSILKQTAEMAARAGPVLVSDQFLGLTSYCALYKMANHIVKVDFDYFTVGQLPDLIMTGMNTETYLFNRRLLYDRHGNVGDMFNSLPPCPPPVSSPPSVASFAISAWSVVRMTRRGELLEAVDIMNHMRDPLLTELLCRKYNVPFENFRRMEEKLPCDIVDWLRRTIARPITGEVLYSLREMIGLYLHLCTDLAEGVTSKDGSACERVFDEIERLSLATASVADAS